jgi:pimeloyl-ACP methyl ester carboxylesterase
VLPDLRKLTRVCVYDRANLGRSERGPSPRTSEQAVNDLRALLASAKVGGPYVLVAHSHGGLHAQLFASKYKSEVVGMVMIDVTTFDIDQRYEAVITPEQAQQRRDLIEQNREGVTYDAIRASYAQVRDAGPLPEVPLLVLAHGRTLEHPPGWPVEAVERAWREAQEALAKRSPKGRLIVAQNSGHFIHQDDPQLVIDSVREVVEAAR